MCIAAVRSINRTAVGTHASTISTHTGHDPRDFFKMGSSATKRSWRGYDRSYPDTCHRTAIATNWNTFKLTCSKKIQYPLPSAINAEPDITLRICKRFASRQRKPHRPYASPWQMPTHGMTIAELASCIKHSIRRPVNRYQTGA